DIVTYDYLLHREKRMENQWNIKHDSLGEILDGSAEEEGLESIRDDYAALGKLFSQVTENYRERQKSIQEGASQEKIDALTRLEERLVAQLLITSHSIITDASRLAEEAYIEATEAQRLASNLTVILMIILAITVGSSSLLIARSISKPLTRLADYSRRVGEGEYTADIEIKGKDEVASVASDVKSMVGQLQKHREHLEELVEERTSELTAVNKELEAFAYSVSHDLRAPLRSIDGFSQALMEDYPDKLDEQGRGYLQRVRSATQRMGVLIDDLLSLSRVTRSEIRRETVDLSNLAQSIAKELQETQPERQVDFVIEPGLTTSGDSQLLHQLMENLLGNAWKFTGQHPKARMEFGVTQVNGKETFFIRDDGAGFDMAYADKLFGVFQRLHKQEEFPGTGVGLATVQRITHRHGGQVWAEGKVDEGATFYFTLE
ncbi:ATP-binding protein, partial [Chloroflexota bacterium]